MADSDMISDKEREDKTIAKAEKRARELAILETRLNGHDARLNSINGSIAKAATATEGLTLEVRSFVAKQQERDANLDERERQHWQEKGVAFSKLQAYAAVGAIFTMLGVPFIVELIKLAGG